MTKYGLKTYIQHISISNVAYDKILAKMWNFIKYCIVGSSGIIVDYCITIAFKEGFKANRYIANSIGFLVATISNYVLNKIWTFSVEVSNVSMLLRYSLISVLSLALGNFTIYIITQKTSLSFYYAKLVAISLTSVLGFILNKNITFVI